MSLSSDAITICRGHNNLISKEVHCLELKQLLQKVWNVYCQFKSLESCLPRSRTEPNAPVKIGNQLSIRAQLGKADPTAVPFILEQAESSLQVTLESRSESITLSLGDILSESCLQDVCSIQKLVKVLEIDAWDCPI